jgi:hypothetical protein
MKRAILTAIFLLAISAGSIAADVSCQEFIEGAKAWDGKDVTLRGEVVGDILRRGENTWLNVNDGTNALGVWGSTDVLAAPGIVPGRYEVTGTQVKVDGVFHRECVEHAGETDIHMVSMEILESSKGRVHPIRTERLIVGAALLILALFLTFTRKRAQA